MITAGDLIVSKHRESLAVRQQSQARTDFEQPAGAGHPSALTETNGRAGLYSQVPRVSSLASFFEGVAILSGCGGGPECFGWWSLPC
jgi:hypothetical protein